jgi:hypothetical protein
MTIEIKDDNVNPDPEEVERWSKEVAKLLGYRVGKTWDVPFVDLVYNDMRDNIERRIYAPWTKVPSPEEGSNDGGTGVPNRPRPH